MLKHLSSIKLPAACNIDPVGTRLVGADGIPLQVRGSVKAKLSLSGQKFDHKLVIAEALTSQGILGLDFLETNHCIFSLATGELLMHGKSILPLRPQNTREPEIMQIEVTVNKTCTVEANSEMELMGKMPVTCEGTRMIEGNHSKKVQVMVARAVVAPTSGMVPLRVLNLESEPVTLYKGMRIAKAEQIKTSGIIGSTEQQLHTSRKDEEWDQILNKMIERISANLNDHQAKQFLMVRTKYVHIFAGNPNDLGRTNVLSHHIETTGNPTRQGGRRAPLLQGEISRDY